MAIQKAAVVMSFIGWTTWYSTAGLAAISTAVGNPTPRLTLPVTPVKLGIAAAEGLARALGLTPPVGKALLEKFLEDIAVDGSKIQNELGFEPRFDLARGWRESLGRRPF